MPRKIRAGHYTTNVKAGQFVIRNTGSRNWVVTTSGGRKIGTFDSLGEAHTWLESLVTQPATTTAKNYLRDLLAANAGSELAESIRTHFNGLRTANALISAAEVSNAIDSLLRAGVRPALPSQRRREPVLPKAEAIRQARAALRRPSALVR